MERLAHYLMDPNDWILVRCTKLAVNYTTIDRLQQLVITSTATNHGSLGGEV